MVSRALLAGILGFTLVEASLPHIATAAPGDAAQLLSQAKKATALVKISVDGKTVAYGSAFCINESGLFVTNAHVADGDKDVELVLEPGEQAQRVAIAKVIRHDTTLDLAVLQLSQGGPFTPLPLGTTDSLTETMEITVLGYPFGGMMALDENGFPSISVNTGRITSLRKKAGELEWVQVDAVVNPGNSGGPVLNAAGQVIGIVQASLRGTGMNFAIPVSRLSKLIAQPIVSITPTTIAYDKRSDPQPIIVRVLSLQRPAPIYNVTLTLPGAIGPRTLTALSKDGACTFTAPLLPGTAKAGESLVISGTFEDGVISGHAADRALAVDAMKVQLSEVRHIEFAADHTATVSAGERTLVGVLHELDGLSVSVGGSLVKPFWAKAHSIDVASTDSSAGSVDYSVDVSLHGQSVGHLTGSWPLAGAMPAGAGGGGAIAVRPGAPLNPWSAVRSALDGCLISLSEEQGGGFNMQRPYLDFVSEGALLIGFNYTLYEPEQPTLNSLQPIYLTAHGEKLGMVHGTLNGTPHRVSAKNGYVVTGMKIRAGGNFDGFGLTFTRLNGAMLVADDTYTSPWVGMEEGGGIKYIDSKGGLVCGIIGKDYERIGSIALICAPAIDASGNLQKPVFLPVGGEPFTSLEQILEAMPDELKPTRSNWTPNPQVNSELTAHTRGRRFQMSGQFTGYKLTERFVEVGLDVGKVDYRGFHTNGHVVAIFRLEEAYRFANLHPQTPMTIYGEIEQVLVRADANNDMVVAIKDAKLK